MTQAKDAGASMAIERWLARQLEDYGELKMLKINSTDKTVHVEVLLKGEYQPLSVEIQEYEFSSEGGRDYIAVKRATASRDWVNAVIRNFLIGRKHPLPEQHSAMIRVVLNG
jgi:hypothetical protein